MKPPVSLRLSQINLLKALFVSTLWGGLLGLPLANAQTVVWSESFDSSSPTVGNWVTDDGTSGNSNPTPGSSQQQTAGGGMPGGPVVVPQTVVPGVGGSLLYTPAAEGAGTEPCNNYWTINDVHTPGGVGSATSYRAACGAFPNPFPGGGATNQSLHITYQPACIVLPGWELDGPGGDEWNFYDDSHGPTNPGYPRSWLSGSDQWAYYNSPIDVSPYCNMQLAFDVYLGGDQAGSIDSPSRLTDRSVLYSVDGGATWQVLEDNLTFLYPIAGSCNIWQRVTLDLPPDCDNVSDLRLAFRWRNSNPWPQTTADYSLGAGYNVDNIEIIAPDGPQADFAASATTVCKNEPVLFTNLSDTNGVTPNTYTWNIAPATFSVTGGVVGSGTNNPDGPTVEFTANGTYTVELTVTNCISGDTETKVAFINVEDCAPDPDFIGNPLQVCATSTPPIVAGSPTTTELTAVNYNNFIPCTGGCTEWTWNIVPSAGVSVVSGSLNDQTVELEFATPGTYDISLTVENDDGSTTINRTAYVSAIDCECAVPPTGGGGGPVTLYVEDFDAGSITSLGWNEDFTPSTQGAQANFWTIGDGESGQPVGNCGVGGAGNPTLHVAAQAFPFSGALYDDTFLGFGPFVFYDAFTLKRIESPTIDGTGQSNIEVSFDFIGGGDGNTDKAYLQYNCGSGWTTYHTAPGPTNPLRSNNAPCTPQGQWENRTITLPPACDNNPNIQIGFVWTNNANNVGTDPSFAVNDIEVTAPGSGPPTYTWNGSTGANWATPANWTPAGPPLPGAVVEVPAGTPNDPDISAAVNLEALTIQAGAQLDVIGSQLTANAITNDGTLLIDGGDVEAINVCNNDSIQIRGDSPAANNLLTVRGFLNNNGRISSTGLDSLPDVILNKTSATTDPSIYRGVGTNRGVDYLITNDNDAANECVLEANLSCRSLHISGRLDMSNRTVALTKSYIVEGNPTIFRFGSTLQLEGVGADPRDGDGYQTIRHTAVGGLVRLHSLRIEKLTVPQLVIIEDSTSISNTLHLAMGGFVRVDNNEVLYCSWDNENAITRIGGFAPATGGHIVGRLRRAFDGITGEFEYPLGNAANYQRAVLRIPGPGLEGTTGTVETIAGTFVNLGNPPQTIGAGQLLDGAIEYLYWVNGPGYWNFTTSPPTSNLIAGNYDLLLYCGPDFTAPANNHSFAKRPTGTVGNTWALDGTPAGTAWPLAQRNNILGFSDNAPVMDDPPLPVEASPLQASAEGDAIRINWTTFSETNNRGFHLQRSTTPYQEASFEDIVFLPGQSVAKAQHTYTYRDEAVVPGQLYYYRYIQEDLDGATQRSNLAAARIPGGNLSQEAQYNLNVYPNPLRQQVAFEWFMPRKAPVGLRIYDLQGRLVHQVLPRYAEEGLQRLEWRPQSHLSNGIYIYQLNLNGTPQTGKLLLQR